MSRHLGHSRYGISVLVVDDNAISRSVMGAILSHFGIKHVRCVEGGIDALDILKSESFDLVFMDWVMADMSGLDVTRKIRRRGVTSPVIAITANAMQGDLDTCQAVGMNDYLSKPIRIADVATILGKWIGCSPRTER